jgi:hypothetical protein
VRHKISINTINNPASTALLIQRDCFQTPKRNLCL